MPTSHHILCHVIITVFAGHYVHIDAEYMSKGELAVFGPKTYIQPTRPVSRYCLRFCYYIHGIFLGPLSVVLGYKDKDFRSSLLFRKTGNLFITSNKIN